MPLLLVLVVYGCLLALTVLDGTVTARVNRPDLGTRHFSFAMMRSQQRVGVYWVGAGLFMFVAGLTVFWAFYISAVLCIPGFLVAWKMKRKFERLYLGGR